MDLTWADKEKCEKCETEMQRILISNTLDPLEDCRRMNFILYCPGKRNLLNVLEIYTG